MKTAQQIFVLMQGVWRINRIIIHKVPLESYEGSGFAEFSLLGDGALLYHEKIKLKNLETQIEVTGYQKYKYNYNPDKDEIVKYFNDGRLFYALEQNNESAFGKHLCGQDNYQANYQFKSEENFLLYYEIKGPKKNYTISTEYTKMSKVELQNLDLLF